MSTLAVVQLVVAALLLLSAVETLRARPWWPRPVGRSHDRAPPHGTAPRQRRWLHTGLALVLGGNVVTLERAAGGTTLAITLGLVVGGVVLIALGLLRHPSAAELERYVAEVRPDREEP